MSFIFSFCIYKKVTDPPNIFHFPSFNCSVVQETVLLESLIANSSAEGESLKIYDVLIFCNYRELSKVTSTKLALRKCFPFYLFCCCCSITVVPIYPHYSPQYMFLDLTLPLFPTPHPPIIPSLLPSGHCQLVLYFHVSGSVLLICFVD